MAAGCSTVDTRIAQDRTAFNNWPPPVQDKVVAGQVAIGFTPEQVQVALGRPDRVWMRTSHDGTSQVWSYLEPSTDLDGGFGYGGWGYGGWGWHRWGWRGYGYGLGYGGWDNTYWTERTRVIFDASGHVSQIESITH